MEKFSARNFYAYIRLCGVVLFLSAALISNAQNSYSVSIQSTSLDLPYFSEDEIAYSNIFLGQILNPGLNSGARLRFGLTIEGNGISIKSDNSFFPRPIVLNGNPVISLSSIDLAQYFDINNLIFSGFTKEEYLLNQGLPEGLYRICFTLLDVSTDAIVPVSSASCINMNVRYQDPPEFTNPQFDSELSPLNASLFSWMPRHFTTEIVNYDFSIYEWDAALANHAEIEKYNAPEVEFTSVSPLYTLAPNINLLKPGKQYFAIVKAYTNSRNIKFRNNGFSQPLNFTYQKPQRRDKKVLCDIPDGDVFINEISQGCSVEGRYRKEFIELVAVGKPYEESVNLSGYIIDDNNYMGANIGNESGHIRLGKCFQNIKRGSIILIYNDLDIHPSISPSNDGMPNSQGVYQIRFSDLCISKYPDCPNQFKTESYDCGNKGIYYDWDNFIPMRNAVDVLQIRNPEFLFQHGVLWNNAPNENNPSARMVAMPYNNASDLAFLFYQGTDWNNVKNWTAVKTCTGFPKTPGPPSESPGHPNSRENDELIKKIVSGDIGNTFRIHCSMINSPTVGGKIVMEGGSGTYYVTINNKQTIITTSNPYYIPGLAQGVYSIVVIDAESGCEATCELEIECSVGAECDDGDDCTENDRIDEYCNCKGTPQEDIRFDITEGTTDTLCYCSLMDTCYASYHAEYVIFQDPQGNTIYLDQNDNSLGFNFPYCNAGSGNSGPNFPGCSGLTHISQLPTDLNAYFSANGWTGTACIEQSNYCFAVLKNEDESNSRSSNSNVCWTSLVIKNTNLVWDSLYLNYFVNYENDANHFTSYGCPIGDTVTTITAIPDCDYPTSYVWSTGDTTATIPYDPAESCYRVTVTCAYEGLVCEYTASYGEGCDDCKIGAPCDDKDPCTSFDHYEIDCNCVGYAEPDTDGDGVCDPIDLCEGHDDNIDLDQDGIPDGCDPTIDCESVGQPCNDYNDCTINDAINVACECEGEQIIDVTILDSIVYDTLCSYCIPIGPGFYGYDDTTVILTHSVDIVTSDGTLHTLDASLNYNFFDFPYCQGSNIDCNGYSNSIQDLPNDINDWLAYYNHRGSLGGDKYCSIGLFISDADFDIISITGVTELGDTVVMTLINEECEATETGYHLYVESECDSILSYSWNTGSSASSISIDSLVGCYEVTITCGTDTLNYCELIGTWGVNCDSCIVGTPCDDLDTCTTNDVIDINCDCVGIPYPDSDGDGYCDEIDQCFGFDDAIDTDGDGVPDGCDLCHGQPDSILPDSIVLLLTDNDPSNDPDLAPWGCEEYPCNDDLEIIAEEIGSNTCDYCLNLTSLVDLNDAPTHITKVTYYDTNDELQELDYTYTSIIGDDDFSNGFGNLWEDISSWSNSTWLQNSPYANSPTGCIELKDNTSSSQMRTKTINICNAYKARFQFSFLTKDFSAPAHDFLVQVTKPGGGWTTIKHYKYGVDFVNNTRYFEDLEINGPFKTNTRFRIRSHPVDPEDKLYIDDVKITAYRSNVYSCNNTLPNDFIDDFMYYFVQDVDYINGANIGNISYVNGYSALCDSTGHFVTIEDSNIDFHSVSYSTGGTTGFISFESPNCGDLAPGEIMTQYVVDIGCENPDILWSNGSTGDTIVVPSQGSYAVTVVCPDSCIYVDSIIGDCWVGQGPCQPSECHNNDGYYNEYCECVGGTINPSLDPDGDGLCGPDDPCWCDGENIDTDGDGICDCIECPGYPITFTYTPKTEQRCDLILTIGEGEGYDLSEMTFHRGGKVLPLSLIDSIFSFDYCYDLDELFCESGPILGGQYEEQLSLKMLKSQLFYWFSIIGENVIIKDTTYSNRDAWIIRNSSFTQVDMTFLNVPIVSVPINCKMDTVGYTITPNPISGSSNYSCGSPTYLWSDGSTSNMVMAPDSASGYCVTITCDDGCEYENCTDGDCIVGTECSDLNDCTYKDSIDINCNCVGIVIPDSDNDGVCDSFDICPGFDDLLDYDGDGIPNGCDTCGYQVQEKVCDFCAPWPLPSSISTHIPYVSFEIYHNGALVSNSLNSLITGFCVDIWGPDDTCPGGSNHVQLISAINSWMSINGYLGHAEMFSPVVGTHHCCPAPLVDENREDINSRISICNLIRFVETDLEVVSVKGHYVFLTITSDFDRHNCKGDGEPVKCDDNDPCTIDDVFDEECNCIGQYIDSDNDFVCDAEDQCPGHPDYLDADNDGIPDGCDTISIACDSTTYYPLCEYLDNRLGCSQMNPGLMAIDLLQLQDSLVMIFSDPDVDWDPVNFYAPDLVVELDEWNSSSTGNGPFDADGDGIINYLDPCPCIPQGSGVITPQELEDCCGVNSFCGTQNSTSNIITDGTQANLLAFWMFQVAQDFDINGNAPACAGILDLDVWENENGFLFTSDTCQVEFSVDCNCDCQYRVLDDFDGDGICNSIDTIFGDSCTVVCENLDPCKLVYVKDCECVFIDLPDTDGDGVCDLIDECPPPAGISYLPGETPAEYDDTIDTDNDSIPDCNDPCIGGWMGFPDPEIPTPTGPGDPCDDGNPCTFADSISVATCTCEGIFLDFEDDGFTDCGDCFIYYDDPLTTTVEWTLVDDYGPFDTCSQCYSVMTDTDSDGIPDTECDKCPDFPDEEDYNNNGVPDCIDPPYNELGCPASFVFVEGEGITIIFNSEEITLDDLPNPIGVVLAIPGANGDDLRIFDYVQYDYTREIDGTFEVFYPLDNIEYVADSILTYVGISYADHQNCVLLTEDPIVDVTCPTGFTIGANGDILLDITIPSGTSADLLEFQGFYDLNLTSSNSGDADLIGNIEVTAGSVFHVGGNNYQVNAGSFDGSPGSFSNYSGTITLPNGVSCPYNGGELDGCSNDPLLVIGNPCDDGDTCTHHDRITLIDLPDPQVDTCACIGEPKPDQDGDGLCDEIDPCPEVANTGPDNDGDGYPDCPCPEITILSDSLANGSDFTISLDSASAEGVTEFTFEINGGPDGTINDTAGVEMPLVIDNLPKGYTYNITIIAHGESGCVSEKTVAVDVPFETDPAFCGVSLNDFNVGNSELLITLNPSDTFRAYDFNVVVRSATGGNGRFTGKGFIQIPYFNLVRVNVKYDDILITTDEGINTLRSGYVEITGFGQNILGDDILEGLDSLLNILETVDDILENVIDIVEDVEELIETTSQLVDSSHVECIERAAFVLDSLSQIPNVNEAELIAAKETLKDCKDDYKEALAQALDHLLIVLNGNSSVDGILDIISNCNETTLLNDYITAKGLVKSQLEADSLSFINDLTQGSGFSSFELGDSTLVSNDADDSDFDPSYISLVNDYYSKEQAYQLCKLTTRFTTEINNVDMAKRVLGLLIEAGNDFIPILGPVLKDNTDVDGTVDYSTVISETKDDFENILLELLIHKGYGN